MIREFASDGCTLFFETWRGIDLSMCCEAHDFAWFSHPGDWWAWAGSNVELALCFAGIGAWEISALAWFATSTVGAVLFALAIKGAKND